MTTLTLEQEQALDSQFSKAIIKRLVLQGFSSPQGLKALLLALKVKAPSKCNCGNPEHTSPFNFLWEILSGIIHNYILWANRAGSKSYYAGLRSWYSSSRLSRLETCILGGSESQSEKSYKAMNDFWYESKLQNELLAKEPMMSKTEWLNGSNVSILTASQKSVRGPHPQHLILDEVDEMEWAILEAALSQPQTRYEIPPSIGIYSTNHNIGGSMDKMIEQSVSGGFKVYKWCIWECLESCKDYECATCKLHRFCPGKQMKEADGYYKIADFINKLETISYDALMREWFCKKIGRGDLVYGAEYDEHIHITQIPFNPNQEVYLSIDWGGVNPFSVGVWQYNKDFSAWIRVDEVYLGNSTNQLLMKECKLRPWWKNILAGVADPARADLIKEWIDSGISIKPADNEVDEGIESVKAALKPVIGNPKFLINFTCRNARREFGSYHIKNGKIVKEDDHAMDELRYFVRWQIAKLMTPALNSGKQEFCNTSKEMAHKPYQPF